MGAAAGLSGFHHRGRILPEHRGMNGESLV